MATTDQLSQEPFGGGDISGAMVTDNITNDNALHGININAGGVLTGATVANNTSVGNGSEGINLNATAGNADATVVDNTAKDNDSIGIRVRTSGDLTNATVNNNVASGNDPDGISLEEGIAGPASAHEATGNIVCANVENGLESAVADSTDAEGTWWGDATGPTHPSNATGTGDPVLDSANGGLGTVDFDPWVDTVSGSGGPATQSQPTTITFQFTGGSGAVALTDGPGDPNGTPTFTASTDNGTVSTSGFIKDGKLEITVTPANAGQATVTVTGPCGLDDTLGGNSVVLDVAAVAVEPTPTPAELPTTGGEPGSGGAPSDGGSGALPWLVAIAGALALMGAGGFWLAVQTRRIR